MLRDYVVPADAKILCVGGQNVRNIAIRWELLNHLVSYYWITLQVMNYDPILFLFVQRDTQI